MIKRKLSQDSPESVFTLFKDMLMEGSRHGKTQEEALIKLDKSVLQILRFFMRLIKTLKLWMLEILLR